MREQRQLVKKANLTKERLLLLTSAIRRLMQDEHFATLLRAESLVDMPGTARGSPQVIKELHVANSKVKPAFNQQVVVLPIDVIVPQKELSPEFRKSTTYKRISSSLEHIGLIEPLVVYPRGPRDYLLLDGHARLDILKQRGVD